MQVSTAGEPARDVIEVDHPVVVEDATDPYLALAQDVMDTAAALREIRSRRDRLRDALAKAEDECVEAAAQWSVATANLETANNKLRAEHSL